MNIKHFLLWLPMIAIAFSNASLRQLVFVKHFNDLQAHQLSTITLIIFCSIYIWFVFPMLSITNYKQAILIGSVWSLLTIVFEFSLGRLTNKSWEYLFRDYNLFAGRIWLLFLICLLLLPCIFYFLRQNK